MKRRKAVKSMEWIRIGADKLKIMLSAEDAARYALDCESTDYADVLTREAFREILTDMQGETGFDAMQDRIYIQMYPSKTGGCELFVTKMGLPHEYDDTSNTPTEPNASPIRKTKSAWRFTNLEHLIASCRRLAPLYLGASQVWKDEERSWWLLMSDCYTSAKNLRFLKEYAIPYPPDKAILLLGEHGTIICPANAIHTFAML